MSSVNSYLITYLKCNRPADVIRMANDYYIRGGRHILKPSLFVDRMDLIKKGIVEKWLPESSLAVPPILYGMDIEDALLLLKSLETYSDISLPFMLALGYTVL